MNLFTDYPSLSQAQHSQTADFLSSLGQKLLATLSVISYIITMGIAMPQALRANIPEVLLACHIVNTTRN
jgi:hypothetical protein